MPPEAAAFIFTGFAGYKAEAGKRIIVRFPAFYCFNQNCYIIDNAYKNE